MNPDQPPSLSTDQIAAFVELAHHGSLHRAAQSLHITEQGVRNRLLALEARLGVELYRKRRGPRRAAPITEQGQLFLPHAIAQRAQIDQRPPGRLSEADQAHLGIDGLAQPPRQAGDEKAEFGVAVGRHPRKIGC